jgi:hypothetical protein
MTNGTTPRPPTKVAAWSLSGPRNCDRSQAIASSHDGNTEAGACLLPGRPDLATVPRAVRLAGNPVPGAAPAARDGNGRPKQAAP